MTIGRDISVFELKKFYDATVFCYGAEIDRHLGIKGEDLKGSYTASQFIGWYNGHPRFSDREVFRRSFLPRGFCAENCNSTVVGSSAGAAALRSNLAP